VLRRWSLPLAVLGTAVGVASQHAATIPGVDRTDVAFPYQPTILGWQIACFALVVFAGANRTFQRVLSLRALVAIGVASYGIYLVHEPLVTALMERSPGTLGGIAAGAFALAAGFAFWAVCERPFTNGSLRTRLLGLLRPLLDRVFAFAGVGRTIGIQAPAFERVAEDYASSRLAVPAPSSPT
jgi:peptidoglycan/LPS O-acetylase OafA/YrhL